MIYDTIVIGRGPAAISCAVYLKRYNLSPVIIAKDNGALENASSIDNYYGFEHISGHDLAELGVKQAKSLDIPIFEEEVIDIQFGETFLVKTNLKEYEAKTIFLALGKKKTELPIKNKNKFDGNGVSYCAICDGFFYKNKRIGLVGAGLFMDNEYNVLKNFSKNITIFTNGDKLQKEYPDALVVDERIVDLLGDEKLKALKTANAEYELDGLFVALGSQSGMSLSRHLGLETDSKGFLVVHDFMTNLPGIFAGGDIIGGLLQVSKSVSDGACASLSIKKYLDNLKK